MLGKSLGKLCMVEIPLFGGLVGMLHSAYTVLIPIPHQAPTYVTDHPKYQHQN